jgi:hypothetical protein
MSEAANPSYPYNREYLIKEHFLYEELRVWLREQPYLSEVRVTAVQDYSLELYIARDTATPEEHQTLFHQIRLILAEHLVPREDGDFGSRVMKWFDDMLSAKEFQTLHVMCHRFLRCLEQHVEPPAEADDVDEDADAEWYESSDEDEDEDDEGGDGGGTFVPFGSSYGYVDTGKF